MYYKTSLVCGTNILRNNVWRDFRLLSTLAMVAGMSFSGKFTVNIDFPIGYFMLPLLMLILEV